MTIEDRAKMLIDITEVATGSTPRPRMDPDTAYAIECEARSAAEERLDSARLLCESMIAKACPGSEEHYALTIIADALRGEP